MTDYSELVKALRCCAENFGCPIECPRYSPADEGVRACVSRLEKDAAAAIEELQARLGEAENSVERWKDMYLTKHEPKRGEMVEVVRCKDCKHRPTGTGVNHDIEFPDAICPCQCYDDYWYSWMPSDDWYCADGEKMEVQE